MSLSAASPTARRRSGPFARPALPGVNARAALSDSPVPAAIPSDDVGAMLHRHWVSLSNAVCLPGMPCSLPRWTEPVLLSVASRLVLPSPFPWRVGVHDFAFEACSSFTHVTACRVARPPYSGLCHEASTRSVTQPGRSSATMFTDNYMGGSFPHWQTAPLRSTWKSVLAPLTVWSPSLTQSSLSDDRVFQ